MAAYYDTKLPQEFRTSLSAIPGAGSAGNVTTTTTDLHYIALTNSTGAAITLKLMNGTSGVVGNFSGYPIDVGSQPYVIEFNPPLRFEAGMKWLAQSAGLFADVYAHRHPGYSSVLPS